MATEEANKVVIETPAPPVTPPQEPPATVSETRESPVAVEEKSLVPVSTPLPSTTEKTPASVES